MGWLRRSVRGEKGLCVLNVAYCRDPGLFRDGCGEATGRRVWLVNDLAWELHRGAETGRRRHCVDSLTRRSGIVREGSIAVCDKNSQMSSSSTLSS
jgi:hypothetical protein